MKFQLSKHDHNFKTQLESCTFPADDFDHHAHLRLAYIYLSENDTEQAIVLMRNALQNFLRHNDVNPNKYHETLTQAWILALDHFMHRSESTQNAEDFIEQNQEMLDSKIMLTHYSTEVLFSRKARKTFVEPNLEPILRYH